MQPRETAPDSKTSALRHRIPGRPECDSSRTWSRLQSEDRSATGSRPLKNVVVQAAIATQQVQQLQAVGLRVEDVLRDVKAIAHTDLHVLSEQSGI